jgi:hypothetical protein
MREKTFDNCSVFGTLRSSHSQSASVAARCANFFLCSPLLGAPEGKELGISLEIGPMFFPTFRTFFLAAILPFTWVYAEGQASPPAHTPRPKMVGPAKWEPLPQEVSAAYWTLEPGWSTALEMRNNLVYHELTVTPILRASTGEEMPLAAVNYRPATRCVRRLEEYCRSQCQKSWSIRVGCISLRRAHCREPLCCDHRSAGGCPDRVSF